MQKKEEKVKMGSSFVEVREPPYVGGHYDFYTATATRGEENNKKQKNENRIASLTIEPIIYEEDSPGEPKFDMFELYIEREGPSVFSFFGIH